MPAGGGPPGEGFRKVRLNPTFRRGAGSRAAKISLPSALLPAGETPRGMLVLNVQPISNGGTYEFPEIVISNEAFTVIAIQ